MADDKKARALLDALDLPADAAQILTRRELRTAAFCELYLQRCEEIRFHDPRTGLAVAKVAPSLAQCIPREQCGGASGWCSLQVRALGILGSAHRIVSDFAAAEASFSIARLLYVDDASDQALAQLLRRVANLRRDQRRFKEAEEAADSAIEIYRHHNLHHDLGCALVDRGILFTYANESWRATGDLYQALSLIDRKRSPRFYYSAAHNLAIALAEDAEASPEEALHWLRYAQKLNQQPESSFSQVKLLWAEGRILERQGKLAEAAHFLQTVRVRLMEHKTIGDYALACLDLAAIYLQQERGAELRALSAEMLPVFKKLRHDADAVKALQMFHKAVITQALTVEILRSVRATLKVQSATLI